MINPSSPFAEWSTAKPLCFSPLTTNDAIFLSSSTTSTRIISAVSAIEAETSDKDKRSEVMGRHELSFLAAQRIDGAVKRAPFTAPPGAGGAARLPVGEAVFIHHSANVGWRRIGKGIAPQQRQGGRGALQETNQKANEPAVEPIIAEGGKPHLPV